MKQLKLITKLRGLIVLALALLISGNASATISSTAATSITSGSKYLISYTSGSTTYYLASDLSTTTTKSEANAFTFTTSGNYYTIQNADGDYWYANKGNVTTSSSSSTWTVTASNSTFTITRNGTGKNYYLIFSGTSFSFSQNSTATNLTLYEVTDGPAAPTFSQASTTFESSFDVTLSCATTGAKIYYNRNGVAPTLNTDGTVSNGTEYTEALSVTESNTILAISVYNGEASEVAEATYTKVYAITCNATGGTVTATPSPAAEGATVTLSNTPADGYTFKSYSVTYTDGDGVTQTIDATSGSFTMPAYAVNITAKFKSSTATDPVTGDNIFVKKGSTNSPFIVDDDYTGTVTYKSADEKIASVSTTGEVTGNNVGYTNITATFTDDDNNEATATIAVNVYDPVNPKYKLTSWTGDSVVYLVNKATGRYLSTGGYWGTEGQLKTTGIPTTLGGSSSAAALSTGISMTQNSKNWGWVTSGMTSVVTKQGLYCDASDNYGTNHPFVFTYNSDDGSFSISSVRQYQLDGTTVYLTQNGDGSESRNYIVTAKSYTTVPDEARWFVVTKYNLIQDFANATASNAQPKEATFFIDNPDFSREVTKGWTFTENTSNYTSGYVRIGNSLFRYGSGYGPNSSVNAASTYIEYADSIIGSSHAYGDNGNKYLITAADMPNIGSGYSVGDSEYYNCLYGGYYNCRILGESGTVSQSFTVAKSGWYTVALEGYVYNPSGASNVGVATFYAGESDRAASTEQTQSDYYKYTTLKSNTYESMTNGGITLFNGGYDSDYHKSLTVYLTKGQTFVIGVKLTGGTFSSATQASTSTFAEFDRVRITYTGDPQYNIILDEKRDGTDRFNGYNYINAQVYSASDNARTLYLKRKFVKNQWNSLVLPVKISAKQFKDALGSNVVLAEYNTQSGNWIYFKSVDLTDGNTAITPGKCYLVKPVDDYSVSIGDEKSVVLPRATSNSITATGTEASPIITITQVVLDTEVSQNPTSQPTTPFKPTTDATDLEDNNMEGLQWMGTYFRIGEAGKTNTTSGIGYGSYAINSGDNGRWYRWADKDNYLGVDGLRCWIGSVESQGSDPAAKLITVIDDEIAYSTDIEGVYSEHPEAISDNRVYNINGQFVGTTDNINKLPKGIYISNGKKYIVK